MSENTEENKLDALGSRLDRLLGQDKPKPAPPQGASTALVPANGSEASAARPFSEQAAEFATELGKEVLHSIFPFLGQRKADKKTDVQGATPNVPSVPGLDPGLLRAEASMDAARGQGVFGVARVKKEAVIEERLTEATARKLKARQAILEEQRKVVEASGRLQQTALDEHAKTAEAAHRLDRAIRGETPAPPPAPVPQAARAPAQPPLQRHVADEDIEYVALQLLMGGVVSEENWELSQEVLSQKFAPYVVAEIGDRLRELWHRSGRTG